MSASKNQNSGAMQVSSPKTAALYLEWGLVLKNPGGSYRIYLHFDRVPNFRSGGGGSNTRRKGINEIPPKTSGWSHQTTSNTLTDWNQHMDHKK